MRQYRIILFLVLCFATPPVAAQFFANPWDSTVGFFPQAAVGRLGNDQVQDTLVLTNNGGANCAGTIRYTDGAGKDPQVRVLTNGQDLGYQTTFRVAPGGTSFFDLTAPPNEPLDTFAILVEMNNPACKGLIKAESRFTFPGSKEVISVPRSPLIFNDTCGRFPIRLKPFFSNAGFAAAGYPLKPFPSSAQICAQIFGPEGSPETAQSCFPFSGAQGAAFVTEIFPGLADRTLDGALGICLNGAGANGGIAITGIGAYFLDGTLQLSGAEVTPTNPACRSTSTNLCTVNNRFAIKATYRSPTRSADGVLVPQGEDGGQIFFESAENSALIVKVLNGCQLNNRFWVFSGGTTNVEYSLTVTDTRSGQAKTYFNPLGRPAPAVTDTDAFATCP